MKKYLHIALMLLCVFVVSSCKDDNDDSEAIEQAAYKLKNETAFLEKAQDPSYVKWVSQANIGYVFAKLIKKGDGKKVYFNSRVSVYYKGSLIDGTVFDKKLLEDGAPFKCAVNSYYANYNSYTGEGYMSVISGWGVALQNMVEGDKYEIWIPQELAYGASGQSTILPYSTLIFELEVVSVDEQAATAS
ncbi:FKBP-type peptidyl-prolyl cis-trans isomerase [Parabacteroides sp. AM08-6]|uniref:FKBP-type peptidyl-prolyl cis-trans isomerase n=1 Tax=Parabacteroides sp. AM08-6 TaxID=2292053 RepID=UPI000EFF7E30|nr:FKBP-type peptidyl-prolyl cis-trans isomerase [Parabacteroides sp. AM08-6]RHJ81018.1 peptidylprolyl isomerase [Parabacteroides sp. AM08-6]